MNVEIRQLQDRIVEAARRCRAGHFQVSGRVVDAFYKIPRHEFVARFRHGPQWVEINDTNRERWLPAIYGDTPLIIWGEDAVLSTISQPSFVLFMLELLDVQPGHRAFELGTGSGWNAALIGELCRPGEVVTYEIIPGLAQTAAENMRRLRLDNVRVIQGDGTEGSLPGKFDRGVFTAGSTDLPASFYELIEEDGVLLFVLERHSGTDLLIRFQRRAEGFYSTMYLRCGFVPVTGPSQAEELGPRSVVEVIKDLGLSDSHSEEIDCPVELIEERGAVLDFLQMFAAHLPVVRGEGQFIWLARDRRSAVVVNGYRLVTFGEGRQASDELREAIDLWREWGSPSLDDFTLSALPSGTSINLGRRQILQRRKDSVFIWTLP